MCLQEKEEKEGGGIPTPSALPFISDASDCQIETAESYTIVSVLLKAIYKAFNFV